MCQGLMSLSEADQWEKLMYNPELWGDERCSAGMWFTCLHPVDRSHIGFRRPGVLIGKKTFIKRQSMCIFLAPIGCGYTECDHPPPPLTF